MKNKHIGKWLAAAGLVLTASAGQLYAQDSRHWSPQDSTDRAIQRRVDSQPDSTRNGFFHAARFHSSFHVQFEGDAAYLFQEAGAVTAFQIAWVINHKISIGGSFSILTSNNVLLNQYVNSNTAVGLQPNHIVPNLMTAGLTGGYIFRSGRKLSFEPQLGIGWAYIHFADPRAGWVDQTATKSESYSANYVCINPSVSMIWNATKFFRPGIVIGGNGVFGKNYLDVKATSVSSFYGGVFLRFGTF